MKINRFRSIVFLLLLLTVLSACTKKKVENDKLPFSDKIVYGTLENGLQYYIRANDMPLDKVELRLNVRSGSLNETEEERGIAHFVEHMAFNGTRNFKGNDLIKFMEEAGLTFGQHSNAYTSANNTNYQLSVPAENPKLIEDSFMIMRDWADGITFDPEEIGKEKGVITEEWRNRNGARYRMSIKSREYTLSGSRYPDRDAIGLMEVIAGADKALLKGYYDKWYTPENMSVIVVGNIDPAMAEELIKKHFSSMEKGSTAEPADKTVPVTDGLRFAVISDPEATATSVGFLLFSKESEIENYGQLKQFVLERGAMNMLSKRVSAKIFEKRSDLLGFVASKGPGSQNEIAIARFGITTRPETIDSDIKEMLMEVERAKRFGFTLAELDEFVTTQKTQLDRAASPDYKYPSSNYAEMISSYDTGGGHMTEFAQDKVLYDRIFSETNVTSYNRAFSKLLDSTSKLVLITVPERDLNKIDMDADKFAAIEKEVSVLKLTAEDSSAPIDKLVDKEPEGGKIKSRKRYDNVDGELITYENGVRLFVKYNPVDKSRYMFAAKKAGGLSILDDASVIDMNLMPQVILSSGFEGISRRQLQQYMAGKEASINISASEYTFDLSGGGDSEDIEVMFQLLYKYITSANTDKNAFSAIIKSRGTALANHEKDKQTLFGREAAEKMYNNAYRRGYLLSSDLPGITEDRLAALYRNNFLDVNNFIYVISGDVDVDEVAELGRKYLAGFKPDKTAIEAKYRGLKLKNGFGRLEGAGDAENRATVGIRLDKDVKYIKDGEYLSTLARRVLNQRLRENIREEMGGVYGVSAAMGYNDYPEPNYFGRISFTCDPARKDEIIDEIRKVMDDMAEKGVTAKELETAKSQQNVAYDSAGEQNNFWVNNISYGFIKGDPIISVAESKDIINSMSLDAVNSFIKTVMKDARMFISVYNPEKSAEKGSE